MEWNLVGDILLIYKNAHINNHLNTDLEKIEVWIESNWNSRNGNRTNTET